MNNCLDKTELKKQLEESKEPLELVKAIKLFTELLDDAGNNSPAEVAQSVSDWVEGKICEKLELYIRHMHFEDLGINDLDKVIKFVEGLLGDDQ